MNFSKEIAVIVPVGPQDNAWETLYKDLEKYFNFLDVVFVGAESLPPFLRNCRWVQVQKASRAHQINIGAQTTKKKFLWILHCDSRIDAQTIFSLNQSLKVAPQSLHYFNLKFSKDGGALMWLNTLGVWVRSHLLKLPFGDQGFCISRKVFKKLGGMNEFLKSGEDHHFVWKALKQGIPIKCTNDWLETSARKYRQNGWMKTTCKHVFYTTKQVLDFSRI